MEPAQLEASWQLACAHRALVCSVIDAGASLGLRVQRLHTMLGDVLKAEATASAGSVPLFQDASPWMLDSYVNFSPVAAGQAEWRGVLADFWQPFDATVQAALDVSVTEVIDQLDALLEPMLFPARQVSLLNTAWMFCWWRIHVTSMEPGRRELGGHVVKYLVPAAHAKRQLPMQ